MTQVGLNRIGSLSYGWDTVGAVPLVTWDGSAQVTYEVSVEYNPDGKEVLEYHHAVTVSGVVAWDCLVGETHEQAINRIRSILAKPCQLFIHKGGGLGDIAVTGGLPSQPAVLDDQSVRIDQPCLMNGPLPQTIAFRPMGRNAAYVDWRVQFATAHCPGNIAAGVRLESISSTISYSLDAKGLTTRSVDATIKFAQTLTFSDNALVDGALNGRYTFNPDAGREIFTITPIASFARTQQSYRISSDRRSLSVNITDREIESRNAYPAGTLEINARHRVRVTQTNMGQIQQNLSGSVECPPRASIAPAFSSLLALIQQRVPVNGIVTDFEFTESIFGPNTLDFTVNWYMPPPQKGGDPPDRSPDYSKLLEVSGLFSPAGLTVDETFTPYTWSAWSASAAMTATRSKRGHANLAFNAVEKSGGLFRAGGCYPKNVSTINISDTVSTQGPPTALLWGLENSLPSETDSWNEYENGYTIMRGQRVIYAGYEQDPQADTLTPGTEENKAQYPVYSSGTTQADEILYQAEADYKVEMKGFAIRFGYQIPRPKLTAVGSAACNEIEGKFTCRQIGWAMNLPIYGAAWKIVYKLPHSPGTVSTPTILPPITDYEP